MSYGENIKAARKAAKLTQEELAKRCGMATITIGQYERNLREPRQEQLQSIASALGIHILELIGYPASVKSAQYGIEVNHHFSIDTFAEHIHKKYEIPKNTAKSIIEECFHAFQLDGKRTTEISSLVEQFDSLSPEDQKSALDYLHFLIQQNPPEESSGESQ